MGNPNVLIERQTLADLGVALANGTRERLGTKLGPADTRGVVNHRAERQIELAVFEHPGVAPARRRHDREPDPRRFVAQHFEDRGQDQRRKEVGRRDHEAALGFRGVESLRPLQQLGHTTEDLTERLAQRLRVRSEGHASSDADQQLILEQAAQRGQRMAHRRLRHPDPSRRLAHAARVE
jgi:hypothetical protein